ncbi:AEC family transporter [Streptococcus cameli]
MSAILLKALGFILIILLGYTLRIRGVVKKEDSGMFSGIVMNVTLPCALLSSASSISLGRGFFLPILLAILMNLVMDFVGYWTARHQDAVGQGTGLVQISGYNIGTFSLPFIQAFFPAAYLAPVMLFDSGNAIMVVGGNYTLATLLNKDKESMSIFAILRKLFGSIPFVVYLLSFLLAAIGIRLPQSLLDMAAIAGDANPFLAMLILGILLDFRLEKQEWGRLFQLLFIRLTMSSLAALCVYYFLPLPLLVRQMLVICLFSPISGLAPVFALKLGSRSSEAANINSLTILATIPIMIGLVLLFAN